MRYLTIEQWQQLKDIFYHSYHTIANFGRDNPNYFDDIIRKARSYIRVNYRGLTKSELPNCIYMIPNSFTHKACGYWLHIVEDGNLKMPEFESYPRHKDENYIKILMISLRLLQQLDNDYAKNEELNQLLALYRLRDSLITVYDSINTAITALESDIPGVEGFIGYAKKNIEDFLTEANSNKSSYPGGIISIAENIQLAYYYFMAQDLIKGFNVATDGAGLVAAHRASDRSELSEDAVLSSTPTDTNSDTLFYGENTPEILSDKLLCLVYHVINWPLSDQLTALPLSEEDKARRSYEHYETEFKRVWRVVEQRKLDEQALETSAENMAKIVNELYLAETLEEKKAKAEQLKIMQQTYRSVHGGSTDPVDSARRSSLSSSTSFYINSCSENGSDDLSEDLAAEETDSVTSLSSVGVSSTKSNSPWPGSPLGKSSHQRRSSSGDLESDPGDEAVAETLSKGADSGATLSVPKTRGRRSSSSVFGFSPFARRKPKAQQPVVEVAERIDSGLN